MNSDNHTLADFAPALADRSDRVEAAYAYYRDFRAKGYFQHRRELLSPPDRRVLVPGPDGTARWMIMMGSNNYLGLASDPRVIEAATRACREHGTGSGGAAMLSGTTRHHRALEEELADWLGTDDAVVFPSGFAANLGTLSCLLAPRDRCAYDELVHASLIDGLRMSRCRAHRFRHNSPADLERLLGELKPGGRLTMVVDGVYSMDGDLAALDQLLSVVGKTPLQLFVDESHSLGVVGPEGRGTAAQLGLERSVFMLTGSFGKALAASAGFAATSAEMATYLRLYARSYFFSTAPPAPVLAAAREALRLVRAEPERRQRLLQNAASMRSELRRQGWDVPDHPSAIVVVPIGEEILLRRVSRRLDQEGLYVNPVPFPAVPRGQGRLRLGVMATHTPEDLDRTLEILGQVGREFGLV